VGASQRQRRKHVSADDVLPPLSPLFYIQRGDFNRLWRTSSFLPPDGLALPVDRQEWHQAGASVCVCLREEPLLADKAIPIRRPPRGASIEPSHTTRRCLTFLRRRGSHSRALLGHAKDRLRDFGDRRARAQQVKGGGRRRRGAPRERRAATTTRGGRRGATSVRSRRGPARRRWGSTRGKVRGRRRRAHAGMTGRN